MKSIKHRNLLHLHDLIETDTDYYLITELCKDGDLETLILSRKNIPEPEALYYLKQIMSAFLEMHSKKIIHRDFKLANVYLNSGLLIIGDFGFAKVGQNTTTSKIGTPYYMAPEVLFSAVGTPYTSKCDLFSIGVVYFYMLFGHLPFPASTLKELE